MIVLSDMLYPAAYSGFLAPRPGGSPERRADDEVGSEEAEGVRRSGAPASTGRASPPSFSQRAMAALAAAGSIEAVG